MGGFWPRIYVVKKGHARGAALGSPGASTPPPAPGAGTPTSGANYERGSGSLWIYRQYRKKTLRLPSTGTVCGYKKGCGHDRSKSTLTNSNNNRSVLHALCNPCSFYATCVPLRCEKKSWP